MMWKINQIGATLIAASLLMLSAGCESPGRRVEIPEWGFSMKLPAGWQTDTRDRGYFFESAKKDDNLGWVTEYPIEGKTLSEFVEASSNNLRKMRSLQEAVGKFLEKGGESEQKMEEPLPQPRIISRTSREISDLEAIEVLYEGQHSVIEVFIRKEDKVIGVLFRTLKDDFPKYESSLRKAIGSIRIQ